MARLDDLEAAAVERAVGPWGREVARLKRRALAELLAKGELTQVEVRALLASLTLPGVVDLTAEARRAAVLGDAAVTGETKVHRSKAAEAAATGIHTRASDALADARARAAVVGRVTSMTSLLTTLAPLTGSVSTMTGDAEFVVNRARNEAVVGAAAQVDGKVVFVPERDACVDCTERGGETGEAATSDPPPVHPHCRCELQPYEDEAVPLALQRESVRSLLRGFSLPSESQAARLRAAQRTLARKPVAPDSVKRYAARAVRQGGFPRGRSVPTKS